MSGGTYVSGGRMVREFIELGGGRINKVILSNYLDELLNRFLGEEVALSRLRILGRFHVAALRISNGEVYKTGLFSFLILNALSFIGYYFLGAVLFLVGWSMITAYSPLGYPILLVGGIICLYTIFKSIFSTVTILRAWFFSPEALFTNSKLF